MRPFQQRHNMHNGSNAVCSNSANENLKTSCWTAMDCRSNPHKVLFHVLHAQAHHYQNCMLTTKYVNVLVIKFMVPCLHIRKHKHHKELHWREHNRNAHYRKLDITTHENEHYTLYTCNENLFIYISVYTDQSNICNELSLPCLDASVISERWSGVLETRCSWATVKTESLGQPRMLLNAPRKNYRCKQKITIYQRQGSGCTMVFHGKRNAVNMVWLLLFNNNSLHTNGDTLYTNKYCGQDTANSISPW